MLDRASSFQDRETVELLTQRYVPVALDVWYHERRKDPEGDLYRKIVTQRKNLRPGRTTQGFYIATPSGELLNGWNNRNPERLKKRLKLALAGYASDRASFAPQTSKDRRFERPIPKGAVVVDVRSRIEKADWGDEGSRWQRIHRKAIGRDHLWITDAEHKAILTGTWPKTLTRRIARYHLIDNTRGEPPMWAPGEVREASLTLDAGKLVGRIRLQTEDETRWYDAAVLGFVAVADGKLARLDIVVRGTFFGEGRWTSGAPKKPFTLAIAFGLADPDLAASRVPPQGARSLRNYLEAR